MGKEALSHSGELRCFCTRSPLLALYGSDHNGLLYVHIKVYKQSRLFAEVITYGGPIKIRCRECLRWHRIRIHQNGAELVSTGQPVELESKEMNG